MRTIICDSCCLIHLKTGGLLEAMLGLPYRFEIPETTFKEELLTFSSAERKRLESLGLNLIGLSKSVAQKARKYNSIYTSLSPNDCFVLVLAEQTQNSVLLTGDRTLRNVASKQRIEVHGILWIMDCLHAHNTVSIPALINALNVFKNDEFVFVPEDEIQKRLGRLIRNPQRL